MVALKVSSSFYLGWQIGNAEFVAETLRQRDLGSAILVRARRRPAQTDTTAPAASHITS
jgi:hypothetical protein